MKRVCSLSELKPGKGKRVIVDDVDVAIFKIGSEVFAVSNVCPHQHSPLIYDGFIEDNCVVCPAHGWKFDLKTGRTDEGSRGLDVFEVKIVNEEVYVKAFKRDLKW